METNDTTPSLLTKEVVDAYFDIKLIEARLDGAEDYAKFLIASRNLWENNRSLHVKLAADIAQWKRSTDLLNESVTTQNLYLPPTRAYLIEHDTWKRLEALGLLVLFSVLSGISLAYALDEGGIGWCAMATSMISLSLAAQHLVRSVRGVR